MVQPTLVILAALLVISCIGALLVRRLVWSLILLFYSSLLLGGILFWYGAIYAGLFHIVTFAGVVSVMFMVIIMLTEEAQPEKMTLEAQSIIGPLLAALALVPFLVMVGQVAPVPGRVQESVAVSALDELGFLWNFRSWDLVFVAFLTLATLLVVINLFSKEGEVE